MQLLQATKKQAFSEGRLLCVGEVTTLNVTRGCAGQCAFCFARCYTGAPAPGQLLIYSNLAGQLRRELDTPRRHRPPPDFVILGSAGDLFLGGPDVVDVSRACIEVLLRRGIGVSFATRGMIPDHVIELLARHATQVRIAVSIASLGVAYTRDWEPGAVLPEKRLFLLDKLRRAGLAPQVRIEPLIPYVNDSSHGMRALASALVSVGQTHAMLGFLQLRRGVAKQLQREAPAAGLRLVLGSFPSQQETGQPAEFDHLEQRQALAALARIKAAAGERGLQLAACRCHNPNLPAATCAVSPPESSNRPEQPDLFTD